MVLPNQVLSSVSSEGRVLFACLNLQSDSVYLVREMVDQHGSFFEVVGRPLDDFEDIYESFDSSGEAVAFVNSMLACKGQGVVSRF